LRLKRFHLGPIDILVTAEDATAQRLKSILPSGWSSPPSRPASLLRRPLADGPIPTELMPLAEKVEEIEWYHTIDLRNGLRTPGVFNQIPYMSHFHLPERLEGKRVLDVATFDGFWAFEFERRGAREVVAVDLDRYGEIDLPPSTRQRLSQEELDRKMGNGFRLAHEILSSKVQRMALSIYDLSPETVGLFDFVFLGDVLEHLQNPIKAIQNVRNVTRGVAYIAEYIHPSLPGETLVYAGGKGQCLWWHFSTGALRNMILDAGFRTAELLDRFPLATTEGPVWQAVFKATP